MDPLVTPPPPVTTATIAKPPSTGHKKLFLIVGGFLTLFVGIVSGLYLVSRPVQYKTQATNVSYQCREIKVFDTQEREIAAAQRQTITSGTTIRLAVVGSGVQTDYSAVRFTINGVLQPESALKLPISGDLYQEYTIPQGTTAFQVSAQVKAKDGNWY